MTSSTPPGYPDKDPFGTLDPASTEREANLEVHIARARIWARRVGCHYERETEVYEYWFGERGTLRGFNLPQPRRNELMAEWRAWRGIGIKLEREQAERLKPPPDPLPEEKAQWLEYARAYIAYWEAAREQRRREAAARKADA